MRLERGERGGGICVPRGRLPFLGIPAVIEETLAELGATPVHSFDSLYEADREAREVAEEAVLARA